MKVLVTGATGFIGTVLLEHLAHDIVVLGRNKEIPKGVEFFQADIDSLEDYSSALEGVDVIIHLAARVHVMNEKYLNPLSKYRRTNVKATLNLAHQAEQAGVKRFIFISSAGVYGNSSIEAITEKNPVAPEEPFAISKFEAENNLSKICRNTDMDFVIIRPPMVYGNDAPGNFGLMVKLILTKLPIPLANVGNSRSFVSVWNLVDLIKTCIEHPEAHGKTFVVCDGENLSTSDFLISMGGALGINVRLFPFPRILLKFCAKLFGKQSIYNRLFSSFSIDDSYTRRTLNWTPPLTMHEGLRRCFKKKKES
ncbi:MAG: NAD-dependent epimerase/dehydratase family protein [Cycloclasticus sp.]|jgi:Nucleoside-diphosphate-sugar epimerases